MGIELWKVCLNSLRREVKLEPVSNQRWVFFFFFLFFSCFVSVCPSVDLDSRITLSLVLYLLKQEIDEEELAGQAEHEVKDEL